MTTATIVEPCPIDMNLSDARAIPPNYNAAKYERPSVTTDLVVLTLRDKKLQFLAIKRGKPPYAGFWALPGGFAEPKETVIQSAARELLEETNVSGLTLHQFGVYSEPGRDPRTWVISIGFVAIVPWESIEANPPIAGDDAREVKWFDCDSLPTLAFDHSTILADALTYVQTNALTTAILKPFFNIKSTNETIYQVYRMILNKPIKRGKLFGMLKESGIIYKNRGLNTYTHG